MKTPKVILTILIIAIFIIACQSTQTYKCTIESLVLDKTVFPKGATEDPINMLIKDKPARSAARTLYYNNTVAFQDVIEYSTSDRAKKVYQDELITIFPQDQYVGSWEKPNFDFKSRSADDYQYACGKMDDRNICRYHAHYKTYIVYLQIFVSETGFSLSDFQKALNMIDLKMEECLSGSK